MKKLSIVACALSLLGGGYVIGHYHQAVTSVSIPPAPERTPLYYHCPMHPGFKSDRPGIAPCCGMQLEPVYAESHSAVDDGDDGHPLGALHITPDKQQIIGVRTATVEKTSGQHLIRALGRVVVDENRDYPILAGTDGWILEVFDGSTTGSIVRKDQRLATFYGKDFLQAQQNLIYGLTVLDRTAKNLPQDVTILQNRGATTTVLQAEDNLRAYGMGEEQIKEISKTRAFVDSVPLVAPAAGLILARSIALGQRFDRGAELFRIADLQHVWILVDLFENEASFIRPGSIARVFVPNQKMSFQARVSSTLPQFDSTTRTLKVRLEVHNPKYALRPGMFADVEFPITLPPTLGVPSDAVLDTGLNKVVFVDLGGGRFEPRHIETGWRFDGRVEILEGLAEGERIVVAGNFLIDSESRLKASAARHSDSPGKRVIADAPSKAALVILAKADAFDGKVDHLISKCVSCSLGMEGKAEHSVRYGEYSVRLCSEGCKDAFSRDPEKALAGLSLPARP